MSVEPPHGPPPYPPPHPGPGHPPPGWSPYPPFPPPPHPPYGPQPRRRSRTRLVLAALAAVAVVATAVVVPLVVLDDGDRADGRGTTERATGLDAVETYDDLATTHVDAPVDYPQVPPVGGPHFDEWLDCGVYDSPVPDENAVHDLEHGTVWITYDPSLSEADVALLEDALPQNGILSPYDDLPAPVVATVWGAQLALDGADDPRLAEFVDTYDGGVTAPEPMASCAGGTASLGDPA